MWYFNFPNINIQHLFIRHQDQEYSKAYVILFNKQNEKPYV